MSLNRRQLLGTLGGAVLPRPGRAAGSAESPAKAAIILFLQGGLSHFESFDPKPDAPTEVRGEFGTIPTAIPGIRFSEHIPLLAKRLNRFSIVRSAYHPTPDHIQAIHITLCGCELPGANIDSRNRNLSPAMGSIVAKYRAKPGLPGYVTIPHRDQLGHRLHYGDAGSLGAAYAPVDSGMLPIRSDLPYDAPRNYRLSAGLTTETLRDRIGLVERFQPGGSEGLLREGMTLLAKGAVAKAFDLGAEPKAMRQRYGDHAIGQETVLARRLAEAGVPFTLVNYALDQVKGQDWDTHEDNFNLMKRNLLPHADRAVSTLLDDLQERGLLDTTVVAVLSEFGRTPKINAKAGRDHWPNVFSVMLAGGGLKPGVVVGSSDSGGAEPKDRPVHIYDVLATIYRQLGIPADELIRDAAGRPSAILPEGKPIPELIGT
ncbi:MAG: DUF1501 domain-containing protein [Gemmataceae bacterium]